MAIWRRSSEEEERELGGWFWEEGSELKIEKKVRGEER